MHHGADRHRSGQRVLRMSRIRSRIRSEDGFSFPELMVGTMIMLLVAAGAMSLVTTMVRSQPKVSERTGQIQQGRTMLERVTRELRQGNEVTNASVSGMRIQTFVDGAECGAAPGTTVACWVTYACGATSCTRTAEGQAAQTVVRGITGPAVFCYAPWDGQSACPAWTAADPAYVALRLVFPQDSGEEAITLDDGTALRNGSS